MEEQHRGKVYDTRKDDQLGTCRVVKEKIFSKNSQNVLS